jgi:two-component system, cell cycle response regulator
MNSPFDDTNFAAKALKLERFLPDGKQAEFGVLMREMGQALSALAAERAVLAECNRAQTEETAQLRHRLRRLTRQCDALEGIFRANDQAFLTFRAALSLSRGLRGLAELPDVLGRLGRTMGVDFLTCLLCQEDFEGLAPAALPFRPRLDLEAALAALPWREPDRTVFLGSVADLPRPDFFFAPKRLAADPNLAGGSCCIASLADKYQPARPIGVLVMADPNPTRYTPEKGSDFLEHFCEVLSGDLQHVKLHEQLLRERESDELTGIPNRAFLSRHGPPMLSLADRKGSPVALLFCDLDRFKAINDTYGHAVGDAVLCAVARTIAERIRDYDLLARLGGDEFVLLLPDATREQAMAMADRVRQAVAEAAAATDPPHTLGLSVSIGVALHVPGEAIADLIRRADAAMYTDKRA